MARAAGDYDNDGNGDLLVVGVGRNYLYRNLGDGTFEDVSIASGIGDKGSWSVSAGWLISTRKGISIFSSLTRYSAVRTKIPPATLAAIEPIAIRDTYTGFAQSALPQQWRWDLHDVSRASGLADHIGKGMGLAFLDFNDDGRLDVFVANDTVPSAGFRRTAASGLLMPLATARGAAGHGRIPDSPARSRAWR